MDFPETLLRLIQVDSKEKINIITNTMNHDEIEENEDILTFFLNYQKNTSYKKDPTRFSPLHYAAKNNSKEIGEILISKGADINAKDIIYQIIL